MFYNILYILNSKFNIQFLKKAIKIKITISMVGGKTILIFSLISYLSTCVIFIDGFYKPYIYLESTIIFQQNISALQFQVNSHNLQILTTQQSVITFNSEKKGSIETNIVSSFSNIFNQKISNIYLQPRGWSHFTFLIDQQGTAYYYDMSSKAIQFQFQTNATNHNSIFTTDRPIFVLNSFQENQDTAILYRYDRKNLTLQQIIETNVTGIALMRAYDIYFNNTFQQETVVLWNNLGFIQALNCTSQCSQMFLLQQNSTNLTISNLLLLGGYTIIVEYGNLNIIQVYNLVYGIDSHSIIFNQTILSLQFFDSWFKNFAAFYSNNSLVVYQAWGSEPFTYIYQYDSFNQLTIYSRIDIYTGKIYILFQNKIEIYKMACPQHSYMMAKGLCAECDVNCITCDSNNGFCYLCKITYYLNKGICYLIIKQKSQLSPQETFMQNLVSNTIDSTYIIINNALLVMQIAPIAFLFFQFINYWNICSFYILINIPIPDYLSVRRLNNVILSCHIFFFHIGFIGMFMSYSSSNQIYSYFSTFTLFFFFTGAMHEILTLIIQSLIRIYQWIKNTRKSRKTCPNIQNKNKPNNETHGINQNKTQKQKTQQKKKQNQRPRYKIALQNHSLQKFKQQKEKQKVCISVKQNYQNQQNIPNKGTKRQITFSKKYKTTKNPNTKNDLIIKQISNYDTIIS